ncbi:HD domain-containing protein [Candidatus Nanohaloarchaea archaeon]|nr:HD domain-containing protein [Candidatus Nanohaloarchaea archaeon]
MKFDDPVYGEQTVENEVLKALIKSEPVQRLKDVHQAGPQPFFTDKEPVTRFEHSLGVMFLLREHGASLEEQIAGLLHDVPHTAFSHVVDFMYDTEDHDYHEDFLEEVIYESNIPEILEMHDLDIDYILDESNFKLLERDMPDLCADRIDYFLRDSKVVGGKDIQGLLEGLTVEDNKFVLEDEGVGERFARRFIQADRQWWAEPKEVAINEIFAQALRRAMDIDLIDEEDLFKTDEEVLEILRESDDEKIQEKLETLDEGFEVELDWDDYDFLVETKARFVDPEVKENGELTRVTNVSREIGHMIEEHKEEVEEGYHIKIKD